MTWKLPRRDRVIGRMALRLIGIALLLAVLSPASAGARYKLTYHYGTAQRIPQPVGIAANGLQNVSVTEGSDDQVIEFDGLGGFQRTFDGSGQTGGALQNAGGLGAVEAGPETGDVYVADTGGSRVVEFTTLGGVARSFGIEGSGNGALRKPQDVAVSPVSPYNIYVADTGDFRIDEFTSDGTFIRRFGESGDGDLHHPVSVAVGPGGNVYVADDQLDSVFEYTQNGQFIRHFNVLDPDVSFNLLDSPIGIAVDSYGELWVAVDGENSVFHYTAKGKLLGQLGGASGVHALDVDAVTASPDAQIAILRDGVPRIAIFTATYPDTGVTITSPPGATTAKFKLVSTIANSTFQCSLDDTDSFKACASPYTLTNLDDGTHHLYVRAVDPDAIRDPTPFDAAFEVDGTPPDTAIDSGPTGQTADSTPTFTFHSPTDPGGPFGPTYKCAMDSGSFTACSSPFTTDPLADGGHTFSVKAKDVAGNTDPSPATRSFIVGTTPPDTTISGPKFTKDTTPTFEFGSNVDAATFECELGTSGFAPCGSSLTTDPLADGKYTVSARASFAGLTDDSPATKKFTVDTKPPTTKLTDDPGSTTHDRTPKLKFKSNDKKADFQCQVDGGKYKSCDSPHTLKKLSFGRHTFKVRAIDRAGNKDESPAKAEFKVKR
jgi:hypothetical protein